MSLLLDSVLFSTDLKFHSEVVSVINVVISQEFSGGAVLNNEHGIGLDRSTNKWRSISLNWNDSPDSVVHWLGVQANFLIPRESGINLRSALSGHQIQWLRENVRIGYESHLLSIPDNIVSIVFNFLDGQD